MLVGDYVYGHSYQGKSNGWTCLEFATGKVAWTNSKLGKGSVTCAGGQLYSYAERDGTCVLVDASPAGWTEHGRVTIPKKSSRRPPSGQVWTHPVVANGKLYLRDQDLLLCYDIKAS